MCFFLTWRAKNKSGCVVTNQRVIHTKAGLLSARTNEVRMKDIRSISTFEGLISGGVRLETGGGNIDIGVRNVREMVEVIRSQKNKYE
ncbi:PH domain-containing protein [Haloferax sp. ATB1]|uniref:PH domain-containing protein n=1 Tax=Haloferax sp. ATB1 TaxID=1508454 RepID=UPI00373FC87F